VEIFVIGERILKISPHYQSYYQTSRAHARLHRKKHVMWPPSLMA